MLWTAAVVVCVAAGCGKKKAGNPQSWCESAYDQRAKGPLKIERDEATKQKYLAECVKQPPEFLKCEASNWMKSGDEKCARLVRENGDIQARLNKILFTGRAPNEPSALELKQAEMAAAASDRKASRGSDPCSQLCGKVRDEGMQADSPKAVEQETECKRRCEKHLAAGGEHRTLVDTLVASCLPQEGIEFHTCIGKTNIEWRKKEGNPEWCPDCTTCTKEVGCE